ncbi:Folate biosynthesis protein PTPS-III [Enhygromyxa salina]|uniref:6-carboxy-5,6,7,8-tetrahydropterin synthase n=1 Tax=Enhygromyxa salina TaxID=215803 RepID=A0A0C2D8S3_9BACT|nr:6-carboxytetrahydropterin synthase [Enhygromyxa salina]KIG16372.1 Folate biosynthesis protein PTPS-III [Enhygromyxa salina]
MPRETTIELCKEDMKFSAGHFTIYDASHRERLHGHNFRVSVAFTSVVAEDGLAFDYGVYKSKIRELCQAWNEYMLIPTQSPHLRIESDERHVFCLFADERIPFLAKDVLLLPVSNVTLEELSRLMLERVKGIMAPSDLAQVRQVVVKVFSGPGQSASATWREGQVQA